MERDNKIHVLKMSNSNYLRTLETAIQFGQPVLIENVLEELDAVLEPVLLKQTFKPGIHGPLTVGYMKKFGQAWTGEARNQTVRESLFQAIWGRMHQTRRFDN